MTRFARFAASLPPHRALLAAHVGREAGVEGAAEAAACLVRVRYSVAARNERLLAELGRILDAFARAGVETAVLKGAALESWYPPGVRAFSDIDVLVRDASLPAAGAVLRARGYAPEPLERGWMARVRRETAFLGERDGGLRIECHTRLGSPPYLDRLGPAGLLARAVRVGGRGGSLPVLSLEDTVCHLALHIVYHYPLPWATSACDLAHILLMRGPTVDWETVGARLAEAGASAAALFGFRRTAAVFGTSPPEEVLALLSARRAGLRERLAFSAMSSRPAGRALAAKLLLPGVPAAKCRILGARLAPDRAYLAAAYPGRTPALRRFVHLRRTGLEAAAWAAKPLMVRRAP